MKKSLIVILVLIGIVVIVGLSLKGTYNNLIREREKVNEAWAQVENVYQRRADLIPNLVNTVKGYAEFEKGTLTAVIEARANATKTTIDPTNLTEANMEQFQQAQQGVSSALSRLMVVVERYPDLKANQNFLDLQAQLEGTENRITVERRSFNETARVYNTMLQSFPTNLIGGMFGFSAKPYFKSDAGAEKAPEVKF